MAQRVMPVLANLVTDADGRVRMQAALALGKLRPESKAAVPKIARLLADPDYEVRMAAYIAIAELGGDSQAVVSALLEGNPEERSKRRISRELAELWKLGPDAKGSVAVLEDQPGDDWLGILVTRSLVRISPDKKREILRRSPAIRLHYTRHAMSDPGYLPPEPKVYLAVGAWRCATSRRTPRRRCPRSQCCSATKIIASASGRRGRSRSSGQTPRPRCPN